MKKQHTNFYPKLFGYPDRKEFGEREKRSK